MKALTLLAPCVFTVAVAGIWAWPTANEELARQDASVTVQDHPRATGQAGLIRSKSQPARSPAAGFEPACNVERRYLPKPDGTTVATVSCERESAPATHPYYRYPNAALESLAYADAEAAQILGMRLIEDDAVRALSLAIRAAALAGGDPAPVMRFSNAYPHPVYVDGTPQPAVVRVKFVLAAVTALLAGEPHGLTEWEAVIREHSADPNRELEQLRARARNIIDEMRRIQVDVSGASTIGGPGDA